MLTIAGIIGIAILIIMIERPYFKKRKQKKELWVFLIFLLFGVGLSIAKALKLTIPNPTKGLTIIFKPLTDLIYNFLLK
ncbi:hypothetical protein [Alkalihalobacillus sp. AL-G]|uniref:hypothetical protein n=1 Tax=Alkalihalobacillus sp. AL-G TaxID=2926399 RepID=UPI002729D6FD|nr:hypothetical protein [Alkalihalobacillus sp. AL-G]WLD91699.1 hypothetical protein MOJ78_11660 [Alkalihalobacillus sp. AL-G]